MPVQAELDHAGTGIEMQPDFLQPRGPADGPEAEFLLRGLQQMGCAAWRPPAESEIARPERSGQRLPGQDRAEGMGDAQIGVDPGSALDQFEIVEQKAGRPAAGMNDDSREIEAEKPADAARGDGREFRLA